MTDTNGEVRSLREGDLREGSGFFETLQNLRKEPMPDFERMKRIYRARLRRGVVTNVVEVDGMIISTTSTVYEPKFIHNGDWIAHVEDVATQKGYEGKGYASLLLSAAIEHARTFVHEDTPELIGCYKVILDCSDANIPFYEKHGFYRHENCMRLDL